MTPPEETKDQRYYKKQKEDGEKDFRKTTREDGSEGVRVTRKQIAVRVTQDAADKLKTLADGEGITQWEMLSRILIMKTPRYNSNSGSMSPTNRYSWPKDLLNPEETQVKYKGTTGDKQINMRITSTAWKRLQCHSTATKLSKARIVQSLILSYAPTTEEQRRRDKEYQEEISRNSQSYSTYASPEPRTKYKYFYLEHYDEGRKHPIHKKGIDPEHWTEQELDEFDEILDRLSQT
jgi:hypothetical protein